MKTIQKDIIGEQRGAQDAHYASLRATWALALLVSPCLLAAAEVAASEADSSSVLTASSSSDASSLDEVVVTGTRELNVKARDSVAPIDVISASALVASGATDLRDALERTLPSLNRQSFGGDLGNLTDSIQLRGLSPDHVLILVNGKRRHTTASIYADANHLPFPRPFHHSEMD